MTASEADTRGPVVSVPESDVEVALRPAWQADMRTWGRVRHPTTTVAASRSTWQATMRAEQMFATMTRLDRATQALLCLYVSMLNGCRYCLDDAAGGAQDAGVSAEQMLAVADPDTDLLDARTRAALRYAYWVAMAAPDIPNDVIAELRRFVDDEEFLEITVVISMKCFWNRFATALRIPPEGRCTDPGLFRDLVDLSARLRGG